MLDYLIVGAGFSGAVCARELAEAGNRVLVIDKRPHIGGNAFDTPDRHGVLIHPYGPHIFHTQSDRIFEYLSRFTSWRPYEHRVLGSLEGKLYPFPINRTTINLLYGLSLDEAGVAEFFEKVREPREKIANSEDLVLSSVGRDLCEKFFRGYTRKQWDLDLSELAAGVAARIPTRTNDDDRYFTDKHQQMPLDGYTTLFRNLLAHPSIEVRTGTDYQSVKREVKARHVIWTGPIDEWYGHRFGALPYRSLRFEHEHMAGVRQHQPVGTVNYPNEHAFTRITEFKHLTGQEHDGTSIVREYSQAQGDPFYPVPNPANQERFKLYEALGAQEKDVSFVGRLAEYRYYNMDQAVGAALTAARRLIERDEASLRPVALAS